MQNKVVDEDGVLIKFVDKGCRKQMVWYNKSFKSFHSGEKITTHACVRTLGQFDISNEYVRT